MLTAKQMLGVSGVGRLAQSIPISYPFANTPATIPAASGGTISVYPSGFTVDQEGNILAPAGGGTISTACDPSTDPNCVWPGQLQNIQSFFYGQGQAAQQQQTDYANLFLWGAAGLGALLFLSAIGGGGGRRR